MRSEIETIKYIGFYDLKGNKNCRVSNLAAVNKMNYIASAIKSTGKEIEIISPSWSNDNSTFKYQKGFKTTNEEGINVRFFPTWKTSNKYTRNFKILFTMVYLFFYLMKNVKKNSSVLVYHVQWLSMPIRAAKYFKKFDLILEIEEIYQDVMVHKKVFAKWENKIIDFADKYLLSTNLLLEKLPFKENVVINGVYSVSAKSNNKINDCKIHLVYSGIIDKEKMGAFIAIDAVKYLPSTYHLHILGFGKIEELKKVINDHNQKFECKITYEGILEGDEYKDFLNSCHIGLSTQKMDGKYLETSFPSKILSYLSQNLVVVSGRVECVTNSAFGSIIHYYDNDNPKLIAESIKKIKLSDSYDSVSFLKTLDREFKRNIDNLLKK